MREEIKKEGLEWIKALGIGLVIFLIIRTFLFSNYVVEGESMMPTLQDDNKLVVNKIGYNIGEINRFDVIVFHANEDEDYVKRVIGLPGDQVEYKNDQLFINGEYFEEPYLEEYKKQFQGNNLTGDFNLEELTEEKAEVVPEGKLFVMGDNRRGSLDSRHIGFIDQEDVVGKVNLRYWPLNKWGVNF